MGVVCKELEDARNVVKDYSSLDLPKIQIQITKSLIMRQMERIYVQQQSTMKIQGVLRAALRVRKMDFNICLIQCFIRVLNTRVQFKEARRLA
jgi:hypothetical protein